MKVDEFGLALRTRALKVITCLYVSQRRCFISVLFLRLISHSNIFSVLGRASIQCYIKVRQYHTLFSVIKLINVLDFDCFLMELVDRNP